MNLRPAAFRFARVTAVPALVLTLTTLACAGSGAKPSNHSPAKLQRLSDRGEEKERTDQPGEAAAWWAGLHDAPAGKVPAQLNVEARQEILADRERLEAGSGVPDLRFRSWGPGNFGGRLRGILIHPADPARMLVGSVSGGIWKSTDGGTTWAPTDDFLDSLSVGSMAIDPDDPDRVFVGTGEGFFNIDAQQGFGIFVSPDFGSTWSLLSGTDNSNFYFVNRLVAIPGTNKLLVATRTGLWGTDDFTASTPVWTERSAFTVSGRGFVDLKLDPSTATPNARLYAYHYGSGDASRRVWRSADDGASFTALGATEGIPTTTLGRMEIGVGTNGVVYLAVSNSSDATRGLWRSPAGGSAFAQAASTTAFVERQGWYDLIAGVKPGDSNTVFLGAVDLYKTTNAGGTISKKTYWNPGPGQFPNDYVHADLHVVAFHPGAPDTVYIGCDGGIYKSTDGGENFVSLNNDLRVAQYYGIAAHPSGDRVIGGTQDNGSHLFFGETPIWLKWYGGDGGFSAWDAQQPAYIYGATPQGGLFGSPDGGSTTADIALPSTTGSLFITPFTLDPSDGNRMIAGTNRVYYSANVRSLAASTWTDQTGALTGSVSALTVSPFDGSVAYAGTSSGRLYRTTTLGTPTPWTQIQDASWPSSDVTSIVVDPHDPTGNTIYVTLADYAASRAWKSVNGGTSWTSMDTNLPNIPMFSLAVDPRDGDRLWLGTELGLFTTDGNAAGAWSWQLYDHGPAWTRVIQLVWATDDQLWIGTHGRSIYRADRSPAVVSFGAIDDSASGCDADGFLDPWERVTLPVSVTNAGTQPMTNVVVSLAAPGTSLRVLEGPKAYGTIAAGTAVAQSFDVRLFAPSTCRTEQPVQVTVTDDGAGAVTQVVPLFTGASPMPGPLTEDAEDVDTAFTHTAAVATDDWQRVTTAAHGGSFSWFAADVGGHADKSLLSPWLLAGAGAVQLDFWLRYDLEGDVTQRWDGAVLELQVEGSTAWIDLGALASVPYDGPLFDNNTIPGRPAWSGTQTTWRNALVNLGTTYAGQRIRFRFRVVCDSGAANVGFWVDDIVATGVTWPGCDAAGCDTFGAGLRDGFESGNLVAWSAAAP